MPIELVLLGRNTTDEGSLVRVGDGVSVAGRDRRGCRAERPDGWSPETQGHPSNRTVTTLTIATPFPDFRDFFVEVLLSDVRGLDLPDSAF